MLNYFCINKSGIAVPVSSDTDKRSQIGTIYDREAFGYDWDWGGDNYFCHILFRKSNGSLSYGFIIDPPNRSMNDCTDYPYGTAIIDGIQYYTFIMRQSQPVYTAGGTRWGAVGANCRVACITALAGSSHPDWKGINYVESTKGAWVKVTGDGSDYGFVDTGLSVASAYRSIPFYGSW